MFKKGFSLIELLVVVAIIAILSAIALPLYTQYRGRAQIVAVINILQSLATQAEVIYQKTGTWPSSLTFLNTTFNSTWTYIPGGAAYNIFGLYMNNAPTNGKGILIAVSTTGIVGTPGYIAQTNTTTPYAPSNGYSAIQYAVIEHNGVIQIGCGNPFSDDGELGYFQIVSLPAHCQCQNTGTFYNQNYGGIVGNLPPGC